MQKYDVSIIVPVYNREEIIKPCIESINSQTYAKSKWEVIFVDDASTDSTIATIETFIDKSINCRIIKRTIGSGNASAPRNEGIKASSSKYIFFLDSDDYVDSQLLENGMKMALKNNSDIVYVKLGGPRGNNKRPFRESFVDNADVWNNHLMRCLRVFKFHKLSLLKSNQILFDPNIDVFEDILFSCICLLYSNSISILADKEYCFLEKHEGEHLTHVKMNVSSIMNVFISGLTNIVLSENINKAKIYNGWLIKVVERLLLICKKTKIDDKELIKLFELISEYFNMHKNLFDLSQIYENEKLPTLLFLSGDFKEFHKIANESKALKTIQKDIQKKFEGETGFSKAWVFKNTTVVLDFTIQSNKIAFDLKVDEKKKLLKVWIFSRNNPDSLDSLREEVIKVEKDKLLIFDGALGTKNKAINIMSSYLDKIKAL